LLKPFELQAAIDLLDADLVWSDDFDSIRDSLSNLLTAIKNASGETMRELAPEVSDLVGDLTDDGLKPLE
jgi:hypothetical protein